MNTIAKSWLALPLAVALVGCATTSGGLGNSAERLERAAASFQRDADESREGRHYENDAQDLAAEARDFRETLSDRGADDSDVREAFRDLSQSYHAARDEVARRGDREAEREFGAVTEAYLDVERAMSDAEDRDRYARDD
jgi:hypothetical protein